MGKLANDPPRHLEQHRVPEIVSDVQVGRQRQLQKIRLQLCYFEQHSQIIVETVLADQKLELVEYFVHAAQEDLSVIRKAFDKVEPLLDQVAFLSFLRRCFGEVYDLVEYLLRVVLVRDLYQQSHRSVRERDIRAVQTLNERDLPAVETPPIDAREVVQAGDAEKLHVVVAVIKKLVDHLSALLDQVVIRVYPADRLDGLLQDALAEVHRWVRTELLEDKLVQ